MEASIVVSRRRARCEAASATASATVLSRTNAAISPHAIWSASRTLITTACPRNRRRIAMSRSRTSRACISLRRCSTTALRLPCSCWYHSDSFCRHSNSCTRSCDNASACSFSAVAYRLLASRSISTSRRLRCFLPSSSLVICFSRAASQILDCCVVSSTSTPARSARLVTSQRVVCFPISPRCFSISRLSSGSSPLTVNSRIDSVCARRYPFFREFIPLSHAALDVVTRALHSDAALETTCVISYSSALALEFNSLQLMDSCFLA
mmetsp:Transcript_856/g.2867  ORF Transcript_856/g.2867 Transcript_856/m.2867 type:complete len:266 (-) Transcript_856:436-1233(-)